MYGRLRPELSVFQVHASPHLPTSTRCANILETPWGSLAGEFRGFLDIANSSAAIISPSIRTHQRRLIRELFSPPEFLCLRWPADPLTMMKNGRDTTPDSHRLGGQAICLPVGTAYSEGPLSTIRFGILSAPVQSQPRSRLTTLLFSIFAATSPVGQPRTASLCGPAVGTHPAICPGVCGSDPAG